MSEKGDKELKTDGILSRKLLFFFMGLGFVGCMAGFPLTAYMRYEPATYFLSDSLLTLCGGFLMLIATLVHSGRIKRGRQRTLSEKRKHEDIWVTVALVFVVVLMAILVSYFVGLVR